MNAASAGKWAAAALFSFVAVLILIAAAAELSKQREAQRIEISGDQFAVMWEDSPVPEAQWVDPATMTDASAALAGSKVTTWTSVDPQTGRIKYEIRAERVDPGEGGRILLTEPRARIFAGERVVRVTAASGELVKPHDAEPESGTLSGGVLIEVFDVGPEGLGVHGLEGMSPSGTMRTASLSFESALGQVSTPDEIELESEGLRFRGRGLTMRVGELERGRRYRLNFLRIDESGGLVVNPDAFDRKGKAPASAEPGNEAGGPEAAPPPEGSPAPDFYRATIQGDVVLAQGARRIGADRLTIFARLLDGKLRGEAIRELALPKERERDAPPPQRERTFEGTWTESFAGSAAQEVPSPEDEITLTWTGPLEIQPERAEPAELARDDVLVWFASPGRGVVEISDRATGASARCASLMYGLTTARLMLSGAGPAGESVRLSAPGAGEVIGNDLEVDLAELPRGVVRMRSAGAARAESGGGPEAEPGAVRWNESAEIAFEVVRHDGDVKVLAHAVEMRGDVQAANGGNRVSARWVRAEFAPAEGPDASTTSALSRLSLEGDVRGASEDGGSLVAESAEVDFGGTPTRPTPVRARGSGAVRVERAGDWLHAEHVDAGFATDAQGRLRVSTLDADTGVALGSARGLGATTEQLRADLDAEVVDLSGDSTELSYERPGTRYALHSSSIRLDGKSRRLVAFGRGDATYRLTGEGGDADSGRMEWTGAMYYDDVAGTADMLGDVIASRVPGPLERQHAEAAQVRISITPWSAQHADDMDARRLLAIDLEGEQETPALLELRRYRAGGADDAELETLVALRSDTIGFDAVGEVLRVPQDGLLLVEDRRRGEVGEGASAGAIGQDTEVRGTTAFEWAEGLTFDRPSGEAIMKRDVRVRHLGLETGRLTQLECESLAAQFRRPGEEIAGRSPLVSVLATDGVFLRHGTIEVVCDALAFDAIEEAIEASAGGGNRVTVLDAGDGRHFTAEQVEVDLRTGQWRAVKATGIRLSR